MNIPSFTISSQGSTSVSTQSSKRKKIPRSTSVASVQNERNDRKAYNAYVDQLSKIKTGLDPYDDNSRRFIQSKMKVLRNRWGLPMNELENWNGSK